MGYGLTAERPYSEFTSTTTYQGHDARIIDMAMSPDGTLVMTAGADETLRLWNCFEKDLTSKKKKEAIEKEGLSSMCRAGKIR